MIIYGKLSSFSKFFIIIFFLSFFILKLQRWTLDDTTNLEYIIIIKSPPALCMKIMPLLKEDKNEVTNEKTCK